MAWVIDRFESDNAVLEEIENRAELICPVLELPEGVREGDTLIKENGRFVVDHIETANRTNRIKAKMERLKRF